MKQLSLQEELQANAYPGRGIVIGKTPDGTRAVTAYFIMGRSENSRNRVFVEDGEGIRTQAFDPGKLSDPSLIIYAPVRVLGNKTIVTNGDQTDTIYEGMDKQLTFEQSLRSREFEPDAGIASENHMENVVWLALESLEPKYRILLYLYYYEGYSIRELIGILKRKESTLQTQLAAGRRKLKEELKKAGEIPKNWEREGK